MKRIVISTFVIGLWSLFPSTSYACWCLIPEVPQAVERASQVFVGEVVDIVAPTTTDEWAPLPGRFFTIKFKVQKSWKGGKSAEVEVLSAQGRYGCFAYPPVVKGEKYLVYADSAGGKRGRQKRWLIITTCNRTALIPGPEAPVADHLNTSEFNRNDASEDLKRLDRMSKPSRSRSHVKKNFFGTAGELRLSTFRKPLAVVNVCGSARTTEP